MANPLEALKVIFGGEKKLTKEEIKEIKRAEQAGELVAGSVAKRTGFFVDKVAADVKKARELAGAKAAKASKAQTAGKGNNEQESEH